MAEQLFLALDFGGTKLSAAMVRRGAREWLALERSISPPVKDARYEYDTMCALARRLLGDRAPAAVGVSFGGPVDAARGRVILSHHVAGWEDTLLRDQLHAAFGAPVSIDNDANVAGLGEYRFGAGRVETLHATSLLYVTVSTGVGGGWVIDGKIFSGADGMAGEIGHTVVDPQGPPCICGRRGCVETMACGPAIARDARARLIAEPDAGMKLRALIDNDLDAISSEHVARAADAGDELAGGVLDAAARALGFGIGTAITLMNPERVVIGGGVAKSGERWWSVVRASARQNTLPQMRVDIVPAALG
ncbi:MAG: ROK family protein, partial [Chloroflexota bacterium]|nr:ROK family protein [Chloroflexota bacterium]